MQSTQLGSSTPVNVLGVNVAVSATVTATYADGTKSSCVFVGSSCTTNGVTISAGFGDTVASQWNITNGTTNTISSLSISLVGAAFNPCMNGNTPTAGQGTCSSNSTGSGTPIGWGRSISGDGLGGISGSVAYSNALHLSGIATPIGDLFTQVTFSFTNFSTGVFNFYGDTDLYVPNPEPTTISLVGLALVGLGLVARQKR